MDRPVAETSTWTHTTLTRDKKPFPLRDSNHNPNKWVATDPHLRTRGHRDRIPKLQYLILIFDRIAILYREFYNGLRDYKRL
jgi:hypothetical protein